MKRAISKLLTSLMAVAAVAALLGGCSWSAEKGEAAEGKAIYHELTQEAAKARMDSGDSVIILDVRTQEEYDAGHIEGAILLPNESIGAKMPEILPDKDAEILIYCRSGNRSAQAANKLVDMGYTAVYDFGGINSWGYGIVTE